jgi:hypothetical protein
MPETWATDGDEDIRKELRNEAETTTRWRRRSAMLMDNSRWHRVGR